MNKVLIPIGFLFLMLLYSCENEDLANKVLTLTEESDRKTNFIRLLTDELDDVNITLSEINPSSEYEGNIVGHIVALDSALVSNKENIDKLQSKLREASKNSSEYKLAQNVVATLESQLAKKEREIIMLKRENGLLSDNIEILSDENKQLLDNISSLESRQEELTASIATLTQESKNLSDKLRRKDKEIRNISDQLNNTSGKEAQGYFDIASDLMSQYDNIKGPFMRKKKKEYIGLAYKNFIKSCQLNHPDAKDRLRVLFTDKDYYKNLDIDIDLGIANLVDCGI